MTSPMSKKIHISTFVLFILIGTFSPISSSASCIYEQRIEVTEMEKGNVLEWSTSQEVDNQTFAIQKSLDGLEFFTEGIIRGSVNSQATKHYKYLDLSVGQNRAFYRLIDIDSKGNYTISETIVIDRQKRNDLLVTTMSNPETDRYFNLTVQSNIEALIRYHLQDEANKIVKNGKTAFVKGKNVVSIDMEGLVDGIYKVSLVSEDEVESVFIRKDHEAKDKEKQQFALKNEKKGQE